MNTIEEEKLFSRTKKEVSRIGVFGVGYDRYWAQFPGLLDELMEKQQMIIDKIPDKTAEINLNNMSRVIF